MKNIILYTILLCFAPLSNWGQIKKAQTDEKKAVTTPLKNPIANEENNTPRRRIKHYHIEEVTPLRFGGHTTTYDVSDPKLIPTYNLGPNNTRTITIIYADEPPQQLTDLKSDDLKKIEPGANFTITDKAKKTDQFAYIDIVKTYERVSDKGFSSVEMLKIVGDSYFFNDELDKAEECYTRLFGLTTDLEPQYYYRYSIALKAKGKTEQAELYLQKFNEMSSKLNKK